MKTALKVVSILDLFSGIMVAFSAVAYIFLFAAALASGAQGEVGAVGLGIVLMVATSVLEIVCCVMGLRAVRDPRQAMPAVMLGGISLLFALFSLATAFSLVGLLQCLIPAIYFTCALGLKNRANQDSLH